MALLERAAPGDVDLIDSGLSPESSLPVLG
jgi:hypothetical protein